MNWINSWKAGNKKEKYQIDIRIGTLSLLEVMFCPCETCKNKKSYCARSGGIKGASDRCSANYWSRRQWKCGDA